jgi:two-component system phosphate regulon sensor histidine kinase PhoR
MTSSKPRRVWIVDDSALDAERARRVLTGSHDVQVFQDGSAALECLTVQPPPDLMVLDWVMPGITGVEVCRFLRSGSYARIPIAILLLTSHRAVEQIVEGLSAGANDYLPKPYEDEELQARVMSQIRSRELLERALDAEDINRRLLESAPDAMLAIDESGRVTFVNEEACRVLALPRLALLGQPLAVLIPALPALLRQPSHHSYRTLSDVELGGRLFSPTVRLPATATSAAVTISLRDVTERRQADARRLDFYSMIAHDLRSPLNAMSLRTDLMLNGRHGALTPELTTNVHKIQGSIQSLVVMINDFLEMARFEGTPIKLEREPVDVATLIDTTMEGFRPLLEQGGLEWQRHACDPDSDCRVIGDTKRLSQVFTNLLGNAIKFTPPQGRITTTIQVIGVSIEIVVEDTGRGVPAQDLPTLFDRYTRAAGQGTEVAGSGLGLMIVREIVEAHGGSVGVESRVGAGSRFWVRLPSHSSRHDPSES